MRTLTQVWVFFIALTFLFLLLGFQLAGRLGLFVAFLISLFLVYATLHRGIRLFKRKLNAQDFSGNDITGFLTEIQNNKLKFGFRKIHVYKTLHSTPPLIWRSRRSEGHLIVNSKLLDNLNEVEVKLLSIFLLSHLQTRSFLITPILSVINQSFFNFNIFSIGLSHVANFFFKTKKDVLDADLNFRNMVDYSHFEAGYFVNKLHQFEFHQTPKQLGTEYFSVLSLKKQGFYRHYGLPDLNLRLQKIMGFNI
jgi:hypothetical protein